MYLLLSSLCKNHIFTDPENRITKESDMKKNEKGKRSVPPQQYTHERERERERERSTHSNVSLRVATWVPQKTLPCSARHCQPSGREPKQRSTPSLSPLKSFIGTAYTCDTAKNLWCSKLRTEQQLNGRAAFKTISPHYYPPMC
uniref:Uncharacterized protein n=1 Tax=Anguilla anguilla TaxID=7936 RepID=A0A0E9W177_ANGAN